MAGHDADVIVVGAGLAGAAAALRLSKSGIGALVIEAGNRIGGRAYLKAYRGQGPELEFGGAWITPQHTRIRTLAGEHGLTLRPRHAVTRRLWRRDGAVHETGPTSQADRAAHERAIARVAADAAFLKKGCRENEKGEALTGITFGQYLRRLAPPLATRNLFSAWWTVSGNGDHERIAASEFLSSCAYGGGLAEAMIDVWVETVSPGMAVLAGKMIAASGAGLMLSTPVASVMQSDGEISVVAADGREFKAQASILALGLNQLSGIAFKPPLPPRKSAAIEEGHGGRAFKVWILAEGVDVGTLVTGDGTGLEFAFAERAAADGKTLIVGFGLMGPGANPGEERWIAAEFGKLFPSGRFVSHDWHDWLHDAHAKGTWVAAPAGHEPGLSWSNWRPEGRIAFASSDYAPEQAGWFEAAVIAGEAAAGDIAERMLF